MIVVSGVAPGIAVSNQSNDASNRSDEIGGGTLFSTSEDANKAEIAIESMSSSTDESSVDNNIRWLGQSISLGATAKLNP